MTRYLCILGHRHRNPQLGTGCTPRVSLTTPERFWASVDPSGDCWLWQGAVHTDRGGYGAFQDGDGIKYAHRAAWELENGPIPEGMQVCHHCDNPPCVRGSHLFLGTQKDNIADMLAKGRGHEQKKTICPQGHPYDEENTRYRAGGGRECRKCRQVQGRARSKRYRMRRRQQHAA